MKVVVLGGGVIGVTTAYLLARSGCEVTLVERRSDVGLETSFANAGEITPSGASPWPSPQLPFLAARWLLKADAPLKIRATAGMATWRWARQVLGQCSAERFDYNRRRLIRLANYSRDRLRELRAETGLDYDAKTLGVLHLYRDAALDQAERDAPALQALGVPFERLDWSQCQQAEPGLKHAREPFAGGLFFKDDESGDCLKFTQGLAALAKAAGVTFAFGKEVQRLEIEGGRIIAAIASNEAFRADAFIMSLGSWSPLLAKTFGAYLPVQPVKGYSLTVDVADQGRAPRASIMDEERKVAVTRLGNRIRVAGTAELAGFNADLPAKRLRPLRKTLDEMFPGAAGDEAGEYWSGFRPTTPDGAPIIGRGPLQNLYFNLGHGTLGFTMACGSARIVTDLLLGREPEIESADLGYDRFSRSRAA
ncbi:D-amino acid dehydrogenase [Sphingosinicella rhizophila]|uniref:D-amino acid dehydrogenase n=1 Tax=Sphingosinicella rhizophila TaxID=3050082 RepID=A0ABU3Q5M2_9SPHN|nr:D-amino acid dehydrogenase [Sphingosinicella sp. GR2756]MDT9598709.1 D-amino acid dehydrogenase [Sphingosinicella sp. GR2756]